MDHSFQELLGAAKYTQMVTVMETQFGKEFLEENGNHALQQLWHRDDFIAGVELYYLSQCIDRLFQSSPGWVNTMIKDIKDGDANNFRGNVFEIIALGMLCDPQNTVTPMASNNPGIDGIVELVNGKKIRFSIKNYNLSVQQADVNRNAKMLEQAFVERATQMQLPHLAILIEGNVPKLLKHHWDMLFSNIDQLLTAFADSGGMQQTVEDTWRISITALQPHKGDQFSNKGLSYTFTLCTPHHPNEEANLISRIESGLDNLEKHGGEETDDVINFIWIQLPPTVSFNKSIQWAADFLERYPDRPVSGIMMYQPFFYNDEKENNFYLINPLKFVTSEKYKRLGIGKNTFPVDFPTGRQISDPPAKRYGESGQGFSPEDGIYVYQSGIHNYSVEVIERDKESVTLELKLVMPDFGITRNNIIEIDERVGVKLESRMFPPGDRLLLI